MITPTLIQNLAWKGYLIFMCLNLVFVPVRPVTILVYATMTKYVGGFVRFCFANDIHLHADYLLLLPRDGESHARGD